MRPHQYPCFETKNNSMKRLFAFIVSLFALVPLIIYAWWPEEEVK